MAQCFRQLLESMTDIISIRPAQPKEMTIAARLFQDYSAELGVDLGFQDFETEMKALPGDYAPPRGALLLAFDNAGTALGCVAMRPMPDPQICEMKRLHVSSQARGCGLGRRLSEAILDAARDTGYARMRLDTLERLAPALTLYKNMGFVPIPAYYDNPLEGVVYLEKVL
jgi:GNAT superfamily N-acetyltransferase